MSGDRSGTRTFHGKPAGCPCLVAALGVTVAARVRVHVKPARYSETGAAHLGRHILDRAEPAQAEAHVSQETVVISQLVPLLCVVRPLQKRRATVQRLGADALLRAARPPQAFRVRLQERL